MSITRKIEETRERMVLYDEMLLHVLAEMQMPSDPVNIMRVALIQNDRLRERTRLKCLEARWFTRQWELPR